MAGRWRMGVLATLCCVGGRGQEPVRRPVPPQLDSAVWGMPQQPYQAVVMRKTVTLEGQKRGLHSEKVPVCRDSLGRVRSEGHYDSGQLGTIEVRDPVHQTRTGMNVVTKTAVMLPDRSGTQPPPPGRGWLVQPLPARVVAGLPGEGWRYTRTFVPNGEKAAVTTVEEVWVDFAHGLVLQMHFHSPTVETEEVVEKVSFAEPDQAAFAVPSDYRMTSVWKP